MSGQQPVIKNEILEFAPLDGHQYRSMDAVHRREYTFSPGDEGQTGIPADPGTDAASQTDILQDPGRLAIRISRIVGGHQRHGLDGTGADTFAAAGTGIIVDGRQKIRRLHRLEYPEFPRRNHSLAAAATAIADKVYSLLYVLTELDQVVVIGFGQQVHAFGDADGPGITASGQRLGAGIESHADFHGCSAVPSNVFHLVPAITDADANMAGGLYNFTCPFVIEHQEGIFIRQGRLVHINPAKLGISFNEEAADEILFNV